MRYKLLGRSGLRVSEVSLGTMTFGEGWGWGASREECKQTLGTYMEAGGNFIDTANLYTFGEAESILGDIITPALRNRMVIASKFSDAPIDSGDVNAAGNHRKSLMQAIEGSLRRLKTDRIDIYYIHTWDFTTRPDEVMRGLDDLVRQGKILYAGISDAPAWVISRCNEMADHRGWSPFVAHQFEYSLLERTPERDLIPMSRALDIGMVAWSPLASGILSGKYTRPANANEKRRLETAPFKPLDARNLAIAKEVDAIADELGCLSVQVALAWVRAQGAIPILGITRPEQLTANLAYLDIGLSAEQLGRLDAVSAIELGFPHDFARSAKGFIYGGMFDHIDRHREEGFGVSEDRTAVARSADKAFKYTDMVVPNK